MLLKRTDIAMMNCLLHTKSKKKQFSENLPVLLPKLSKAKGVSYMENQCGWHGSAPNAEQCEIALKELTR